MLTDKQDAFGHEMYDYFSGCMRNPHIHEIIERDDGFIEASNGPAAYFLEYRQWPPEEKKVLRYARGRVLDIGCGAGRHSLYLQGKGLEVVGVDNSPLAVEVCKKRGLRRAELVPISQISSRLGIFDTVVMMGNNFGLFGSYEGAKHLLKKLDKITTEYARILTTSNDVYKTDNPVHLKYHEMNRKRGRMAGQLRLRVRYLQYTNPWFDYLIVSPEEMEDILNGTGWKISRIFYSTSAYYAVVIDKKK
jgi:SAM-dependent methyltransferase